MLMRGMTEMAVKRYSNENHVRSEIISVIFAVIFYPLAGMRGDERGNLFAHTILKLDDTISL